MIRQSATIALALTLCLAPGCNRDGGNKASNGANAAPANSATGNASAAKAHDSGVVLALDPEGLRAIQTASGSTRLLAFGSSVDDAVRGLNVMFGSSPSEDGTNSECGGGPARIIQWSNGFSILAQDGKLAGWEVSQAGPTTMNGIGVGSTRAQLDEAFEPKVEQSSLGTEFSAGDGEQAYGGLLSGDGPDGRVTAMWAGFTCHFR